MSENRVRNRMNSIYGAKMNQVRMMRYRGFTNADTYTLEGGPEGKEINFIPFDDDLAASDESYFNTIYSGEASNLVTFYITPSEFPFGPIVKDIVMVYWAESLDKEKIGKAYIGAATNLYYRVNSTVEDARITSIVIITNKPLNPDALKASRTDIGAFVQVFGYLDLMPLTHVQRIPSRLMTEEELREFPYADQGRICPVLFIDDHEVMYNGVGPRGKWLPGTFVRCDRSLPKATSFAEKSIMFRVISADYRPKLKIPK